MLPGIPGLIHGLTVTVERPVATGVDAYGDEVRGWEYETVDDVIPDSPSTSDLDVARGEGERVDVTFHFPSTYTESLDGCRILWDGRAHRVIGDPVAYPASMVPGRWNRSVRTRCVDG